ncbi:type I phosphomannose isomerase catalytic subunit [Tenacibaculum sp. 190524A05c]|uniref:type I phosphomannose isomerase catalytic subunit n=1 Tax=Tenacibaculum platacis TaxID=3137852 RepID=UPI0032B14D20
MKEKIWGGDILMKNFNKVSINTNNIGESWELSGVTGDESVVSNGDFLGMTIVQLVKKFKSELVGHKVYSTFKDEFPLLFKFIDARENLSIQLHPNDELAAKRHNSFGKTEMWYILEAEEKAKLYAGLTKTLGKKEYIDSFNNDEILDLIHTDKVQKGDAFFIEVGTIHAIGKGIVLAEIQQTSDVTYRIYDWDRVDKRGNSRELHTDLAIDAIDFTKIGSCKVDFLKTKGKVNNIYSCKYFTTNNLVVSEMMKRSLVNIDSFVVYMCVDGKGEISVNGKVEKLKKGETVLLPACVGEIVIINEENFELLEVFIE